MRYGSGQQPLSGCKQNGYLPENGPLYEEMTPIALLNFGDARSMDESTKKDRISEVIEQCALNCVQAYRKTVTRV